MFDSGAVEYKLQQGPGDASETRSSSRFSKETMRVVCMQGAADSAPCMPFISEAEFERELQRPRRSDLIQTAESSIRATAAEAGGECLG
jgi:hypothetical protein